MRTEIHSPRTGRRYPLILPRAIGSPEFPFVHGGRGRTAEDTAFLRRLARPDLYRGKSVSMNGHAPDRVSVKYDREWQEYIVSTYEGGKKTGTYHTNDKADAEATAKHIRGQLGISGKNFAKNFGASEADMPIGVGERGAREYMNNPELLIVRNGKHTMRRYRKSRNPRLTIKLGKKRVTYRGLVKKVGFKKAPKIWRGKPKYHAGKVVGCPSRIRRSRKGKGRKGKGRKHSVSRSRKHTRKGSYRALVKKFGVKKASKIWRGYKRKK